MRPRGLTNEGRSSSGLDLDSWRSKGVDVREVDTEEVETIHYRCILTKKLF